MQNLAGRTTIYLFPKETKNIPLQNSNTNKNIHFVVSAAAVINKAPDGEERADTIHSAKREETGDKRHILSTPSPNIPSEYLVCWMSTRTHTTSAFRPLLQSARKATVLFPEYKHIWIGDAEKFWHDAEEEEWGDGRNTSEWIIVCVCVCVCDRRGEWKLACLPTWWWLDDKPSEKRRNVEGREFFPLLLGDPIQLSLVVIGIKEDKVGGKGGCQQNSPSIYSSYFPPRLCVKMRLQMVACQWENFIPWCNI